MKYKHSTTNSGSKFSGAALSLITLLLTVQTVQSQTTRGGVASSAKEDSKSQTSAPRITAKGGQSAAVAPITENGRRSGVTPTAVVVPGPASAPGAPNTRKGAAPQTAANPQSASSSQTTAVVATSPNADALTKILHENETSRPSDATVAQLQSIIDKSPQDFYARLVMGNTLDRLGLPMQAIEQYQLAVKLGPNSPRAIIELVKAQIGVGQREAAMRLLQEASKRFPNDKEIMFWMGNYYLSKNKPDMAEDYFKKAGEGSDFFGLPTARAEIQLRNKKYGLAIMMAENDLRRDPNYAIANAVKGLALFNLRQYRSAEPCLKIAFANFPLKDEYAKRYAETSLMIGNDRNALEPAMVALAITSRNAFPDDESKWLLTTVVKRLPYAFVRTQVPIFAEKLDKFVNTSYSHYGLAEIMDACGYHDIATTQYYRAFKLDPGSATTAFKLANNLELYFQKYDEAIYYLTEAHTLNPGNVEIADRLDRLRNRLPNRPADLAWQLKDLIWSQRSPI